MSKEVLIKILENIQANEIKTVDITYITEKGFNSCGYGCQDIKTETLSIKG